jgi:hypothetical protein
MGNPFVHVELMTNDVAEGAETENRAISGLLH